MTDELYSSFIDAKPQDYNWYEHPAEEEWELVYPDVEGTSFEELKELVDDYGLDVDTEDFHERIINCIEEDGTADVDEQDRILEEMAEIVMDSFYSSDAFEPMMNYYYPIDIGLKGYDPGQAQLMLDGLSVVLVHVNTEDSGWEYVLALSGGGMDLSWDICEAYVRLGYYPPVHFCDLPRYAGYDTTQGRYRRIVEACIQSCRIQQRWAEGRIDDLNRLLESWTDSGGVKREAE